MMKCSQAKAYLPTDWPVKDSQIAEVAAVHGIAGGGSDYDKLKAELKAKLKAEKLKPHEVINYGVHNEHPSHALKDSYRPPPHKEPHSPYETPEMDLYEKPPPPPPKTYSEPPPRPQPTYDVPKETTYGRPEGPSYRVPKQPPPPPPKGGYALPKPPIGAIIDSYGLPQVNPPPAFHEEVPVYRPTGPPMPTMYYDSIPDHRHPESKKPAIERPYDLPAHDDGFVPTAPRNNFDAAIDDAVQKGEEDKFSFEGFSDSFPFGRKATQPAPPSFKRPKKSPPKFVHKSKHSGKAKFPPAPEFKTPAFKDATTPTGYSVFKQTPSFKDDYYSFEDDFAGPQFRAAAAGGEFGDYEDEEGEEAGEFPSLPPPPPMVFDGDLATKFPVRENVPLVKAAQPPPPPPPPGPPPPPPPPFPKISKHGAVDVAEIGLVLHYKLWLISLITFSIQSI